MSDPLYLILFVILFYLLYICYRMLQEIKKVSEDNATAVQQNTAAVREYAELLRQNLPQKPSETE